MTVLNNLNIKVYFIIVNLLTLSRFFLSSYFSIKLYFNAGKLYEYLIIFFIIVLTDFLDGFLARKWQIQSKAGSMLDVSADFFCIISLSLTLYLKKSFPGWMIFVISFKMAEFIITSHILKFNKNNFFVFDILGKYVAGAFYLLPAITLILKEFLTFDSFIKKQILIFYIIAFLSIISSLQRIYLCIKKA